MIKKATARWLGPEVAGFSGRALLERSAATSATGRGSAIRQLPHRSQAQPRRPSSRSNPTSACSSDFIEGDMRDTDVAATANERTVDIGPISAIRDRLHELRHSRIYGLDPPGTKVGAFST